MPIIYLFALTVKSITFYCIWEDAIHNTLCLYAQNIFQKCFHHINLYSIYMTYFGKRTLFLMFEKPLALFRCRILLSIFFVVLPAELQSEWRIL